MNILSISAAPGWSAIFLQEKRVEVRVPLACWGLVQDAYEKDEDAVVGLVVREHTKHLERADTAEGAAFQTYRHESEKTPQEFVEMEKGDSRVRGVSVIS